MERRPQRVAQIVREFMEAFVLSRKIGEKRASGALDFADVDRLVEQDEGSVLFRLKEECHSLFRKDDTNAYADVQAEELFDLAVGALFHESMKFREGYYTTATYEPRLQRLIAEGSAAGPLAGVFLQAFEAGRRRMLESEAETEELFRETRDQLLIVLRHMPESGAIARSLLDNGHFAEAEVLLDHPEVQDSQTCEAARPFAHGMAAYYTGDDRSALDAFEIWASVHNRPALWSQRAHRILCGLGEVRSGGDSELASRALRVAASLAPPTA